MPLTPNSFENNQILFIFGLEKIAGSAAQGGGGSFKIGNL